MNNNNSQTRMSKSQVIMAPLISLSEKYKNAYDITKLSLRGVGDITHITNSFISIDEKLEKICNESDYFSGFVEFNGKEVECRNGDIIPVVGETSRMQKFYEQLNAFSESLYAVRTAITATAKTHTFEEFNEIYHVLMGQMDTYKFLPRIKKINDDFLDFSSELDVKFREAEFDLSDDMRVLSYNIQKVLVKLLMQLKSLILIK